MTKNSRPWLVRAVELLNTILVSTYLLIPLQYVYKHVSPLLVSKFPIIRIVCSEPLNELPASSIVVQKTLSVIQCIQNNIIDSTNRSSLAGFALIGLGLPHSFTPSKRVQGKSSPTYLYNTPTAHDTNICHTSRPKKVKNEKNENQGSASKTLLAISPPTLHHNIF